MKKTIYVILATILGFLLSLLVHAGAEAVYLSYAEKQGISVHWSSLFGIGQCALPNWLNLGLGLLGIGFGVWLGFTWWRIVYIEKRHWRFRNKKNNADV